ncbi:MAG: CDP-glycerol glycerophosphotransferase family protein [Arcobacteraceae bacterium]
MNKKYYIAPYSIMSQKLYKFLEKSSSGIFLGYIDSSKKGDNIHRIDEIISGEYDFIYLMSPNYGVEIHKYFINQGIKKSVIKNFNYKNEQFKQVHYYTLLFLDKKRQVSFYLKEKLHKKFKFIFEKNDHILLLAPEFIDINIKAFYLYVKNHTSYKVSIAISNQEQCKLFQEKGFNVITYPSFSFVFKSLQAKYKVIDHYPVYPEILNSLINSFIVQIWHGIPLKKLDNLLGFKEITYDLMISTSDFVTDYSFSKLFKYKNIVNSGYPRNDLLVNGALDNKELIFVDIEIYNFVKNSNKKVIIYMPTWRPYSDVENPIDLDDLDEFAKENDLLFIIKSHPFTHKDIICKSLFDESNYSFSENYKNSLLFYPTTDDIYPLLGLSDLLITDYSSIYFDYLLIDKPILFFMYDKDVYLKEDGDFLLDFNEYTPGEKVFDYNSLKISILDSLKNDLFSEQRIQMKKTFFSQLDGNSSKVIFEEMIKLSNS